MNEYSRIIIERYCSSHTGRKAKRLQKLVDASYDLGFEGTDSDALFLERLIEEEEDEELREALQNLDDFLFRW